MKNIKSHLKEIGIILSYIYMLVACYLFDWKPFGIFISYLIEVVVMFLIYAVLRMRDEQQHPERYRKSQPIANVFIGIIPLVLFQYFIIGLISGFINPEENFIQKNMLLTKEVIYAIISTLILYIIKAFQISNHNERLSLFQDGFLNRALAITLTNVVGVLIVFGLGVFSLLPVLTGMVVVRIVLEIYFDRKTKML